MRFSRILPVLSIFAAATSSAHKWDSDNDPAIMDPNYVYELNRLPTRGELAVKPWSETFWQSKSGGINLRWNARIPVGFDYESPSRARVMTMSFEEMKTLSPAEKYDIYMGRYDYPLKREVYERKADKDAKDWEGICDGWTIAAVQFAEPQPVVATNPDGVKVPFGSSDIKGLMAYNAAAHFDVETRQVGLRCTGKGLFGNSACRDINPGAMHVILANQIGLKKQAFIVDRDPGKEIWNQPVYGFKFEFNGSAKPQDGERGVLVHGTLMYTDELDKSQWEPVTGTKDFQMSKIEMDYILDLDASGRIIGGEYMKKSDHPDFFWLPVNRATASAEMEGLNRLYKPVDASYIPSVRH